MSNDLISRSVLMQSLRNNVLVDVTPNLERAVAEQPTAYDVDKVVEQLEELEESAKDTAEVAEAATYMEAHCAFLQEQAAYQMAVEIVKSGGIE